MGGKMVRKARNDLYKDAINPTNKYKGIMLDIDGIRLSSSSQKEIEERILDEVKFQLDDLKYGYWARDDLELQGYTESQVERIIRTAIKHLEKFLYKYKPDWREKERV